MLYVIYITDSQLLLRDHLLESFMKAKNLLPHPCQKGVLYSYIQLFTYHYNLLCFI
jgi:hypothetical protein